MRRMDWQPGSFSIATPDGSSLVEGIVSGSFGIRVEARRLPVFSVTHLPTGMRATPGGGGFRGLDMAKVFAERLMALADWSCIDRDAANRELSAKVVVIWNELIAHDMAKSLMDHRGPAAKAVRAGKR